MATKIIDFLLDGTSNSRRGMTVNGSNVKIFASGGFESSYSGPAFYANVAASSWAYIRIKAGNPLWDIAVRDNNLSGALQFRYAGLDANRMILTTDGKLGVAVNSPSERLDVNGYVNSSGYKKSGSSDSYVLLGGGDI